MRSIWMVLVAVIAAPAEAVGSDALRTPDSPAHEFTLVEAAARRAEQDLRCAQVIHSEPARSGTSRNPRWTFTCRTPEGGALVRTVSREQLGPEFASRGGALERDRARAGEQALAHDWAADIDEWTGSVGAYAVVVALGAAGLFVYLMPGIMATERRHPRKEAIWVVSILLGWTFIGWCAALIWAATGGVQPRVRPRSVANLARR